jgi:hypothetical protein
MSFASPFAKPFQPWLPDGSAGRSVEPNANVCGASGRLRHAQPRSATPPNFIQTSLGETSALLSGLPR